MTTSRHAHAIDIQQGACNPIAIAHVLVEAIQEARKETPGNGADDPAVRLIAHQLDHILNVREFDLGVMNAYRRAMTTCEEKAGYRWNADGYRVNPQGERL